MSVDSRRDALERRHAAVEAQLQAVTAMPSADSLTAAALKREKLRLKDEISRLNA